MTGEEEGFGTLLYLISRRTFGPTFRPNFLFSIFPSTGSRVPQYSRCSPLLSISKRDASSRYISDRFTYVAHARYPIFRREVMDDSPRIDQRTKRRHVNEVDDQGKPLAEEANRQSMYFPRSNLYRKVWGFHDIRDLIIDSGSLCQAWDLWSHLCSWQKKGSFVR